MLKYFGAEFNINNISGRSCYSRIWIIYSKVLGTSGFNLLHPLYVISLLHVIGNDFIKVN